MILFRVDEETEVRLLEPRHAVEVFSVIDRNREHISEWLPWAKGSQNIGEVRAFIEGALVSFAKNEEMACGIWYRQKFTGGIGAHIDSQNNLASLGYWIALEHQGKGLITRAAQGMVEHLFHERGFDRLEIRCQKENQRSRAVAERLGFEQEGILRRAFRLYGNAIDVVVYAKLREPTR